MLVTDGDLNVLGDGVDVVIHADEAALAGMPDVVREMHAKSGLTEAVRASTVDAGRGRADGARPTCASTCPTRGSPRWPATRSPPTAGSSPATCPSWTPTCTTAWSTSARSRSCARRWFPRVFYAKPEKGLAHRALADIEESIRELAYYRRTLFVAPPGPTSEQAQAVAAKIARRRLIPVSGCRRARTLHLSGTPATPGWHGGCSSAGRAPGCGPGGRGFKSRHSPHVAATPPHGSGIDVC